MTLNAGLYGVKYDPKKGLVLTPNSELQKTPTEEVVAVVNQLGLKLAAQRYQIDPSNLWRWLKKQNFVSKRQYVRANTTQEVHSPN